MHINLSVVLFGNVKTELYMRKAVGRAVFIGGHTTHNVGSGLHSLPHQLVTARILDNTLLRKGHDLNVDDVLIFFTQRKNAFKRTQATDCINVNVRANGERSVFNRLFNYVLAARDNIVDGVDALLVPQDFNRFFERAAFVWPDNIKYIDLIEMDMWIDQRRCGQFSARVDDLALHAFNFWRDALNTAIFNLNINCAVAASQPCVLNQQLHIIPSC